MDTRNMEMKAWKSGILSNMAIFLDLFKVIFDFLQW